jgi:hypothetical protein
VVVLLAGDEATCQPKPNGGLWWHICLTGGFSDRLFARRAATVPFFLRNPFDKHVIMRILNPGLE